MDPLILSHTSLAYAQLATLFGGSLSALPEHAKSESHGYMALCFDRLSGSAEMTDIALAHYYEQNGDLVPDPDMVVRIHHRAERAEALSFQDATRYSEVYGPKGQPDDREQRAQNEFLATWLRNCIQQGHSFRSAS